MQLISFSFSNFMQNKLVSFFAFIVFSINALSAQNDTFVLKGQISADMQDLSGSKVYLNKIAPDLVDIIRLDSTFVVDNQFSFTGEAVTEPTVYFVSTNNKTVIFSPEAGTVSMQIGNKNKVSGTPKNDEIQSFLDLQESITLELREINNRYSSLQPTEENRKNWLNEIQPLRDMLIEESYTIAKNNIKNDIGKYLVISLYQILSSEQIDELLSQAGPLFKESETGQRLSKYSIHQNIQQGLGRYLDMTMHTPEGKEVSLSDYIGKGKYVLIDFWASWCGPCIREMPKLVETYNRFKDKGFEIIGVSLDERKQDWVSAINRFNITWVNMSDLKGWKSMAGEVYGITSIPFTLLIDKDGNIMESYLYGEELNYRLQEILN